MRCEHGTPGVRPPLTFAGGEGGDQSHAIFPSFNTLLTVGGRVLGPHAVDGKRGGVAVGGPWAAAARWVPYVGGGGGSGRHGPPHGHWAITHAQPTPAPRAYRKGMEVRNVPRHTLPNPRPSPPTEIAQSFSGCPPHPPHPSMAPRAKDECHARPDVG